VRRLAGLVALLVVAGCAPAVDVGTAPPRPGGGQVWLVGHGWHVGLVVRRAELPVERWPESGLLGEATYLEVGWGDAEYYPAPRGTIALALRAAFRSHASVLHVAAFDARVDAFFPAEEVIEIAVSSRGLAALADFLHRAYARDALGRPIAVAAALYGRGWFYRATGRYGALDNSNTWTARALQAAGCPIDPASSLTAGALLEAARRFGHVVRGPRRGGEPRERCG
jgi:uncharacterized protein (TIGR02117 family)